MRVQSSKFRQFIKLALCALVAVCPQFSQVEAAAPSVKSASEPIDYTQLSHELDLTMLRSGAHNGDKPNQYLFKVVAHGMSNSPEEKTKDFASRKKVTIDLGSFGDTQLDPLAIWRQDQKAKEFKQLRIDGKAVRDLVAKTMTQLQIPENQVSVQTDINFVAKKKKYYVLNDDQVVATVSFSPLVKIEPGTQVPEQSFTMTDDKGAVAKLNVKFLINSAATEKNSK